MSYDAVHMVRSPSKAKQDRIRQRFQRQIPRPPKIVLMFLGGFVMFVIGLVCSALLLLRQVRWNGERQFGFLVVSPVANQEKTYELTIVIARGGANPIILLPIPRGMMIEMLGGYGMYKSESLLGLVQLEKLDPEILLQSLTIALGVELEDMIVTPAPKYPISTVSDLRNLAVDLLRFRVQSGMNYGDRYALLRYLQGLRSDQISVVDLLSSNLLNATDLPGGERIFTLNVVSFDAVASQIFSDLSYRKEGKAIAVVNTTGKAGLASRVARALGLIGMDVVNITQISPGVEKTYVDIDEKNTMSTNAVRSILQVLDIDKKELRISPQNTLQYRADIVIFLGEDVAGLFAPAR
jgi:hypothetical protein